MHIAYSHWNKKKNAKGMKMVDGSHSYKAQQIHRLKIIVLAMIFKSSFGVNLVA